SKLATASAPRQEVLAPAVSNPKKSVRLTLWPLVAATFFMVSGGTYGTEDIVHGAGYGRAILILLITPILWSLPTAFMIGELSSALPAEGGFYAWVRRGLGPFWGFQEAWLSLVASIFDMAIYPTLCVALHGMGQRLHHRRRGASPAAHLSARHDCRGFHRRHQLHRSGGGHGLHRHRRGRVGNRLVGRSGCIGGRPLATHRVSRRGND